MAISHDKDFGSEPELQAVQGLGRESEMLPLLRSQLVLGHLSVIGI